METKTPITIKVCPACRLQFDEKFHFCLQCGGQLKQETKIKDQIMNCDWKFKCPLSWNGLQTSENKDVRFCSSCQKDVHFAYTQSQLNQLASEGKCVAFNPPEEIPPFIPEPKDENPPPPTMGMIAPPPPPPERPPLMGYPASFPEEEKINDKTPWWKIWE